MGQALYRKHRPKKLTEVVGQEHITKTLTEALKQGRISHAYLFTGPRGVGKTSIARILAHEINNLPYADDSSHIDIIEIDAASNRRIDEIRELRDKVHVAPASARYKVYIIDEVHMLTREAFNALLKTLEEPPAHAVFILATTDAHKLPATIVSRTQRYSFKPVANAAVVEHLAEIAKQEKIKISPEALQLLAEHGEGSFRDSISLLDQAGAGGRKLEADDIRRLLGVPSAEAIRALADLLAAGATTAELMNAVTALYDQGYQASAIAKQLSQLLRGELLAGQPVLPAADTLTLLDQLLKVPTSRDPERFLEIVLLECSMGDAEKKAPVTQRQNSPETLQPVDTAQPKPPAKKATKPIQSDTKPTESEQPETSESPTPSDAQATRAAAQPLDAAIWPEVLSALKQKHNTLYGVVRMAQPTFRDDGTVQLAFAFAFHQKRLNEAGNRQKLVDTIQSIANQAVVIECVLDKTAAAPPTVETPIAAEPEGDLAAISNIFGGGELLES